ncbi:UNVERIFIED_ORG: transposase InsO family protein [Buttiauxella agrestis ATCC 33320]
MAVVLDLFSSRKPVGWAMSFFPDSALTGKALSMAWEARGNCWDNSPMERFFRSLKRIMGTLILAKPAQR